MHSLAARTPERSPRASIGRSAPGEAEREEIFWATRRLFEALAREQPLVLFFEDVHWAEPTFLDLVVYLAERGAGIPDSPRVHRPSRAARAATRLGQRKAERELPGTRAPSRCRLRDADRQHRSRCGRGHHGTRARDRRGKPTLHRAARRAGQGGRWPRQRADDPADDPPHVPVRPPGSPRAGRAGRDRPSRRRRQGVLGGGHGRPPAGGGARIRGSRISSPLPARSSSPPRHRLDRAEAFGSATS